MRADTEWWALVMGAAGALEDAANCLRDPDAKRAADGAAKHYRKQAHALAAKDGAPCPQCQRGELCVYVQTDTGKSCE